MKRALVILLALSFVLSIRTFAQDRRTIRAAELSFENGEKNFKRDNYKEAAQAFEIVVNNIPEAVPTRKHAEMRLEALMNLVDIYYSKSVNLEKACSNIEQFSNTLRKVQSNGALKGKDLIKYLNLEQDYTEKRKMCENRETLDSRKEEFEKILEKETGED